MRLPFPILLFGLFISSCGVFKGPDSRAALKIKREVAHSPVFLKSFTGFTLLDPATGKTLADFNGAHYFTPASNIKIFTLATCLKVLGDSVPGMQLIQTKDKLIFRGTGDPTFLHPNFQSWQSCRDTLLSHPFDSICYLRRKFSAQRFGPGWAWDDYNESYQPERSELPIYGNCLVINTNGLDSLRVDPPYFQKNIFLNPGRYASSGRRSETNNFWGITGFEKLTDKYVPFMTGTFQALISDTLHRNVEDISFNEHPYAQLYPVKTLYSTPIDTVLRRMMYQSDNFIAEQMLLVCAGVKFDLLEQDTMISWMLDSVLLNIPQRPRWVDGSGLSRYNLASPQSIAQVLFKFWKEQPRNRLLSFFPAGGADGTLKNWYAGKNGKPYVWAKTGSMSGVICLSGYVQAKSGRILIFSFMHNNFLGSNKAWKIEMQRMLEQLYERF